MRQDGTRESPGIRSRHGGGATSVLSGDRRGKGYWKVRYRPAEALPRNAIGPPRYGLGIHSGPAPHFRLLRSRPNHASAAAYAETVRLADRRGRQGGRGIRVDASRSPLRLATLDPAAWDRAA